jgi:hypothetical protein
MNFSNESLDNLILDGGVEVIGIDPDSGEFLYSFTEKLKEIDPTLYDTLYEFFYAGVMKLWELKLIDIDFTVDNPLVVIDKDRFSEEVLDSLDRRERLVVDSILRHMDSES